ncbi:hypothetical protein [Caballeronia sp. S22]|uniref:hypothetical protein n=1 Tax=Caballeronia sp. S22 TaxID=3137182 RepID=UPI0035306DDA
MNMTQTNIMAQSPSEIYAKAGDAIFKYMADCKYDESMLWEYYLGLALAYVYQPHPRFWRDFNADIVVNAVSRYQSHYLSTPVASDETVNSIREVAHWLVQLHAFHEFAEEIIAELPVAERPEKPESAAEWVCAALEGEGLEPEFFKRLQDGFRSGGWELTAIKHLNQLRAAACIALPSHSMARIYRKHAMRPAD